MTGLDFPWDDVTIYVACSSTSTIELSLSTSNSPKDY